MTRRFQFALSLVAVLAAPGAQALEARSIVNSQGTEVFTVRFFDVGDGAFLGDESEQYASTWNLDDDQKHKIVQALTDWANIIRPAAGSAAAVVNVGTFEDVNAAGVSMDAPGTAPTRTKLQLALNGQPVATLDFGSHAQFVMGRLDFDTIAYVPSLLPRANEADLAAVAFHELAHGLGVSNSAESVDDDESQPRFADALNVWATHLRDDNGNAARPGQAILCALCQNDDPDGFDVREDRGVFVGEHVTEVLAGGLPGVPVSMLFVEPDGSLDLDDNNMSHIELRNSAMSHQNYRNHTRFMEAELALLQDLGYDIDRRGIFGRSVYGSGLTLQNDGGFFDRNAQGTAYVPGTYNRSTHGIGLHIYGDDNHVTQTADLLSTGAGAAGVRVDGEGNTLVVQSGTRIHADGLNGQGVMFTYGRGHNLVQRGEVRARGDMGVGVRFDFGNNLMGNNTEYRGSYIRSLGGYAYTLLPELEGALVDRYDLTGAVEGSAAAIYISPNALVGEINVMQGAQIVGDIVSDYAQVDENGQARTTALRFGRLADAQGRATDRADAAFVMNYDDNILGADNLVLDMAGGTTVLHGRHELYSASVAPGAVLAGASDITVADGQALVNAGTVAPASRVAGTPGTMHVRGDYVQAPQGNLRIQVAPGSDNDRLTVDGTATLDGQVTLAPAAGWYASDWQLRTNDIVRAGAIQGGFATAASTLASPTLRTRLVAAGTPDAAVAITRDADAYARFGQNANDRALGASLDQIVAQAPTAMQPLYQALDFSAPDGSQVARALTQMSPSPYSTMTSASLHRERQLTSMLAERADTGAGSQWRVFATPFGGTANQDARGSALGYDAKTYGVALGAERQLAGRPAFTVGVHGDIGRQTVDADAPHAAKGKATAFGLGAHVRWAPDASAGAHAFGAARLGLEDAKMDRTGWAGQHRADWTGRTASLTAGAGYRWQVSPALSAGPVAMLSYARVHRPGVTESGADATRLRLDSDSTDALRSSLGVDARLALPGAESRLSAKARVTWDREWLSRDAVSTAGFAAQSASRFTVRNAVLPRDSLGLRAGLSYRASDAVTVDAQVSSQRFGGGYDAVAGELAVRWRF